MGDRDFLDLYDAESLASDKQRCNFSLAKLPEDLKTDQKMRQLSGDFAREVASKAAYEAEGYNEHVEALSSL
jgi:hypothetical protein